MWIVARNEVRARWLALMILHGTSSQEEWSFTIAVTVVQRRNLNKIQSDIGPEEPQQKG